TAVGHIWKKGKILMRKGGGFESRHKKRGSSRRARRSSLELLTGGGPCPWRKAPVRAQARCALAQARRTSTVLTARRFCPNTRPCCRLQDSRHPWTAEAPIRDGLSRPSRRCSSDGRP